jgi:hypothetical protein
MNPVAIPTPNQLFRQFELGQINRDQLREAMGLHAKLIIAEVEENRVNPLVAFMDQVQCKRVANKLARQHGEESVREALAALAEIPDFPPATLIWNADHELVPLECFFRVKRNPIFYVLNMKVEPQQVVLHIDHGTKENLHKEEVILRRNRQGKLSYVARSAR